MIDKRLKEIRKITRLLDIAQVDRLIDILVELRAREGRLFIIGVGGSAANASHAVNDFRKICGIETYTPVDNVAELTAITNDRGWDNVFVDWLETSRLSSDDMLMVLSVGGGTETASHNITLALNYAVHKEAKIAGIVGPKGGHTAEVANICVKIPEVNANYNTPYTESFQGIIHHLIVNDPRLKK